MASLLLSLTYFHSGSDGDLLIMVWMSTDITLRFNIA